MPLGKNHINKTRAATYVVAVGAMLASLSESAGERDVTACLLVLLALGCWALLFWGES